MSLNYSIIVIYTNEESKCHGVPTHKAVVDFIAQQGIAARCMVIRGTGGCYENGEIASSSLEILSYNMPVKIEIVLPVAELDTILPKIDAMVEEGVVMVKEHEAWIHRTRARLIPRHLKVRDVMTPEPQTAHENETLADVVKKMLFGGFNGIPVVDAHHHPIGIITQGDLLTRGNLPLRPGLLTEFADENLDSLFSVLGQRPATSLMTPSPQTIADDAPLTQAVDRLLHHQLKRLPVVNATGELVGMLSRLDIFRTVMSQTPNLAAFTQQNVKVENLHYVAEIMDREMETVSPDTPIEEVIRRIELSPLHRIAVVDREGRLAGIISDRDLLVKFATRKHSLWSLVLRNIPLLNSSQFADEIHKCAQAQTAADVMTTDLITVREDSPIHTAIRHMTEHQIKRLPVIDEKGLFKGMISRDAVLRAGMGE
ncbi:MAG: DUF190 domain-containing protein [bacterium]|jgi:CBS domain-containing protein|nr:DUF190 domain-containing protein [bacterium]